MKLKSLAVVISLFAVLMLASACWRKSPAHVGFSNLGPPVMLPKHVVHGEVDPAVLKDSAVIVTIPGTQQFYVGAEQYPKDQVGEQVSRLLEKEAEPNRIVYIGAGLSLDDPVEIGDVAALDGRHVGRRRQKITDRVEEGLESLVF